MKNLFKLSTLSFIVLSSVGCGGGSSESASQPIETTAYGNMEVILAGLPPGLSADIQITGPNNYSTSLISGEVLSNLVTGDYTLSVNSVTAQGVTYSFNNGQSQMVTVSEGQTLSVNINYKAPVTVTGIITGFGSVYINGVKFETDQAGVTANGENDTEDALEVGMVVTVNGNVGADGEGAEASSIDYQANAEGPVTGINLAEKTITLLSQVYFVDDLTEFENITFDFIQIGHWVEVSAIQNSDGQYIATRIELSDTSEGIQLVGEVTQLETVAMTFNIDEQVIDYSNATVEGELLDGVEVEVESELDLVDGVLFATEVEVEEAQDLAGQLIGFEGEIEVFTSITDFVVDDQAITTTTETTFKGGQSSDLALGVDIAVRGSIVEDLFVATEIRIEHETEIKIEGLVESTDLENNSIVILGNTIFTDEYTRFIDDSEDDERRFRIDDILIGDKVSIKAFDNEGQLLASQIKRKKTVNEVDDETEITELEGKVSDISAPTFLINGVVVKVTDASVIESPNGSELTSSEFFSVVTLDTEVDVEGIPQDDGSLLALKIEIESKENNSGDAEPYIKLKGNIDSFNSIEAFTVNGHSITTNQFTRYEGGNPELLVVGVKVEIKGHQAEDGTIVAKKIEIKMDDDSDRESEIEGEITDFISATDFSIGEQVITTTDNTEFDNGSIESLALGVHVEVEGHINNDGTLVADEIEFEEVDEISVKGVVSSFVSATEFSIGEQVITTNSETEFKNSNASMLALGVTLEVEGVLDENGTLVATKVEFEETDEVEVKGIITVLNSTTDFEIDGHHVITDEFTVFKNGTAENLALGVEIEIEGYANSDGSILAYKVEFQENDENEVEVIGAISEFVSAVDFSIGEQKITTTDDTEFEDGSIADLAEGVTVEVEGALDENNVLVAKKIEFKEN
ncbi:hypothetical protein tloyanaT_03450 [Thalassotalea loyana]|uniref:DUF5666 domain-containing protein n=1 Tax=Thalassotalea loyana TaxID=280483 RepID=A0ABQ6H7H8_9GAMM|nr:DUF5666 domain-containing protein [Thalassotalea loyana]GLX84093.1 hypothetical protein tloyanaT_03450 [Thalassotalea loyana]